MKCHMVFVDVRLAGLQRMPLVTEDLETGRRIKPLRSGLRLTDR
jgi:hypothetical protein